MSTTLRTLAKALAGEVSGKSVVAPGPGHSKNDRSLSVALSATLPDGFLVYSHAGDDWRECRDHVRAALGISRRAHRAQKPREPAPAPPPPPSIWPALWRRADDPSLTLVERYLALRGLELPPEAASEAIRFHARCRFGTGAQAEHHPAMVCLIRNVVTNEAQGLQRTALALDGVAIKRNGKTLRMSLGKTAGGCVKIDCDEDVTMGLAIAEGVETALAGRQLGFRPVWAAISASGVAAFAVLDGVDALTIFGETDGANARAVEACRDRWARAGREVTVNHPLIGSDLNDVRGRAAR